MSAQNVRWLAGYKHSPADYDTYAQPLVEAFAEPRPLGEGVASVGEDHLVRPVLFHLCWTHCLAFSLAEELTNGTLVWSVANPNPPENSRCQSSK